MSEMASDIAGTKAAETVLAGIAAVSARDKGRAGAVATGGMAGIT